MPPCGAGSERSTSPVPLSDAQGSSMFLRRALLGCLLVCLGSAVSGCGNPSGLDSIQVTPSTQSLTVGQTAQLAVTGTFGNAKRTTTQTLTTGVTWTSSAPAVATVSTTGLVTAVSAGSATITAGATAFNGDVTSSATLTVTPSTTNVGGGTTTGNLVSLTIIPSSITVGNLQGTGQFLAVGTFSAAPFVRDLTNSPTLTWISSAPQVFPVTTNTSGNLGATAGIATAYGTGGATITAEAVNPGDKSIQTATATFNCPLILPTPTTPGSCYQTSQATPLLLTVTVYNEGLNTKDWRIIAPSATGTEYPLHCGPGFDLDGGEPASEQGVSVCTITYPVDFRILHGGYIPKDLPPKTVVLRATGGAFGGWSYTCQPSTADGVLIDPSAITQGGPNYCVIDFTRESNTNVTVGGVFN